MSDDVICISSSDDEDEVPVARVVKNSSMDKNDQKRKLSLSASETSGNGSCKRFKVDDDKIKSEQLNRSRLVDSDSDGSIVDFRSPKPSTSKSTSTSTVKRVKPELVEKDRVFIPDPSDDQIFQKFLNLCIEDDRVDDEIKKVLKKLQVRYDQLNSLDRDDEDFRLFLNGCFHKIKDKKTKIFQTIYEVKQEIERRLKISKTKNKDLGKKNDLEKNNEDEPNTDSTLTYTEDELIKIKILQKKIKQCQEKIRQLEMEPVDFSDDDNSAYMQEDRYKRKYVQLCEKLSEIAKDKMLRSEILKKTIKLKDIKGDMTKIKSIDEEIVKFINSGIKKMNKLKHIKNFNANADYLVAPDYVDILKIIKKQNEKQDLELTERKIKCLAETAFKTVGKYLQKIRVREVKEQVDAYFYVGNNEQNELVDPASKDPELKQILDKNKVEGDKNLQEVFESYVKKEANLTTTELEEQMKGVSDFESNSEDEDGCKNKERKKKESSKGTSKDNDKSEELVEKKTASEENLSKASDQNKRKLIISSDEENEEESKSNNDKTIPEQKKVRRDSNCVGNDDKVFVLSDDESISFNHKTATISNSLENQDNSDSMKKPDSLNEDSQQLKIVTNLNENPTRRPSTETEEFVLLLESSNSETIEKDPLETSKNVTSQSSDESEVKNKEKSSISATKPLDDSTDKKDKVNDSMITVDDSSNNFSTKKNDDQKINNHKGDFKKNSPVSTSPSVSQEVTNKEKLTNIVKPFQSRAVQIDSESSKSSKTFEQILEVSSSKKNDASKSNAAEIIEVIDDCIEDEPTSKCQDSVVIVEAEKPKIRIATFAVGLPKTWKDAQSPEKSKQLTLGTPIQQVLEGMKHVPPSLHNRNLTSERRKSLSSSGKMINPMARNMQNVVVINNVIKVPMSSNCQMRSGNNVDERRAGIRVVNSRSSPQGKFKQTHKMVEKRYGSSNSFTNPRPATYNTNKFPSKDR